MRHLISHLAIGLAVGVASGLDAEASTLSKVRLAQGRAGFVVDDTKPFVPFGVNYYRPGTGWAPQVWKQFDPAATGKDFERLQALGANCVRVFLTYGSFYSRPGVLDEEGLRKLDQFIELAADHGLYVHPTGPDHWEGLPDWAKTDRIADDLVVRALADFWRLLATRLRGRANLFAYDLLNEPEVGWDTPAMRKKWNAWLERAYENHSALTNAWNRADVPAFGSVPTPPGEAQPPDRRLLDFQRFRETVAEDWTRAQVAAIKAADPEALVTVGLVQWSVPLSLAHARHYSGFRPERQAPLVDFLSFHFYPLEHGAYQYEDPESERRNLAYLDFLAWEHARCGKPVVLAEFGWYGGGRPRAFKDGPAASEEQQARWCRQVVEHTRGLVSGWLNWGLYDHPQAGDVSEFTGLFRVDGAAKAWGNAFGDLAKELNPRP